MLCYAVALTSLTLLPACNPKQHTQPTPDTSQAEHGQTWTCSMHPQIRLPKPGKCPLCGMNLIPLAHEVINTSNSPDAHDSSHSVHLSPDAIALADIQTSAVRRGKPTLTLNLYGTVQADERRTGVQVAHIAGRLERLHPRVTGEQVRKGQVIASIYSPDALLAQAELLEARRLPDSIAAHAATQAAREKLRKWRIPNAQVQALERTGKPSQTINIIADRSGTITAFRATEGDYLTVGAPLYELTDLSTLWAVFEAYETDLAQLRLGDSIAWTFPALPDHSGTGTIAFISPDVDALTRTAQVRVELPNPTRRFRPGMLLEGIAHLPFRLAPTPPVKAHPPLANARKEQSDAQGRADGARKGRGDVKGRMGGERERRDDAQGRAGDVREEQSDVLLIPRTAILWTGRRSIVYVRQSPGRFTMREITTGPLTGDDYIVLSGLTEGEQVVTAGAFTVDAAAQLSGRHSMME